MSWNYRIFETKYEPLIEVDEPESSFEVYEVYYDDAGTPYARSSAAVEPHGDTKEELQKDFERQLKAFEKPVLNKQEFDDFLEEKRKIK